MDRWLGELDRRVAAALGYIAVRPRLAVPFLLALSLALSLPGLMSLPVTDRDEARFAQATKQMLETGDFIDIRFQDDTRYKKPIGIYWLQSASVAALSSGDLTEIWAYRLPSLLAAVAAVLLTWWAARPLYGRRNALLAAILLAAAIGLNLEARLAKADAALLVCIILAQGALGRIYLARSTPKETVGIAALFWIALGVGILLKGPVAPGLALLTIIPLAIYDPERSWLRNLHFAWGIPVLLLITLPWFIAIGITSDWEFFRAAFGEDFLAKIQSGQESHWGPPGYYLILFWWTFWPAALVSTGAGAIWLWRNRMHRRALFLLAWMAPFWLVLEATPTKLPHYILPIYPAIAIASAWILREVMLPGTISRLTYKQAVAIWVFVAALQVAFLVYLHTKFRVEPSPAVIALALAFLGTVYVTARAAWESRYYAAIAFAVASAALLYVAAFRLVLPSVDQIWISREAAQIAQVLRPCSSSPAMLTRYREPSAIFLLGTDTRLVNETAALEAMRKGEADYAFFNADAFNRLRLQGEQAPQLLGCINGYHTQRGRKLRLHVLTMKAPETLAACPLPERFRCSSR